jgi:hypothetical protein
MILAYHQHRSNPSGNIYDVSKQGVKFQYPPSSLFPCKLVPSGWLETDPNTPALSPRFLFASHSASVIAVLVTWATTACIVLVAPNKIYYANEYPDAATSTLIVVATLALCALYYPVLWSLHLGQIQTFLNAAVAIAILAYLYDQRFLAGVLIGTCALVKPQFAIILLWSLWRRERGFSLGFGAMAVIGLSLSVYTFGMGNHWHYVELLRRIARTGETFMHNQSVNGLLNRMIGNGDPANFSFYSFAPFHPLVYAATTASGLLIFALAFQPLDWRRTSYGILGLAIMLTSSTLAAPIAWNHHYGLFLPIFAVILPMAIRSRMPRLVGGFLGLSYLLVSLELERPHWFLASWSRTLLSSHLFFGAIILFVILLVLRYELAKIVPEDRFKLLRP